MLVRSARLCWLCELLAVVYGARQRAARGEQCRRAALCVPAPVAPAAPANELSKLFQRVGIVVLLFEMLRAAGAAQRLPVQVSEAERRPRRARRARGGTTLGCALARSLQCPWSTSCSGAG